MLMLFVIAFFFNFGDFVLIPRTNKEYNVRHCMKRIIDVNADYDTTVFAIYGDQTKGNFLPHPMQNPLININVHKKISNVNYRTRKELVIMDPMDLNLGLMEKLGFFNEEDSLRRKFVLTWPYHMNHQVQMLFSYFWERDIHDVMFLVYDYDFSNNFTEVVTSDKLHPSNRCGTVANNISRFRCDQVRKNRNSKFFRNYSKCKLTYLYETLFQNVNIEQNYMTEFVLSQIVATFNFTLIMKDSKAAITKNDHYVLMLIEIRRCKHKLLFCGKSFIGRSHGWTIPSPKKLGSLEVFKLIYKWNSWILIFLSFVVTCLVWWAISTCRRSTRFSSSVLDVYSITFTGTVNKLPKCFSLRCLFLTYVIYVIHIQTGFTCNLVKFLSVPQYSVIKTLQELADSNLPILAHRSSAKLILNMTHENNEIFEKIKNKTILLSDEKWGKSLYNEQILENSSIMVASDHVHNMVQRLQRKNLDPEGEDPAIVWETVLELYK
ncbi:hypothetical protein FQA39_LY05294 [Lamprigera yunnana]|nr:hypothetical protein FQA39_LY05294 [Lamprigera yunnana]